MTHHPPPASQATAHGVDVGWNDGNQGGWVVMGRGDDDPNVRRGDK